MTPLTPPSLVPGVPCAGKMIPLASGPLFLFLTPDRISVVSGGELFDLGHPVTLPARAAAVGLTAGGRLLSRPLALWIFDWVAVHLRRWGVL